jgi:hypothetical protein
MPRGHYLNRPPKRTLMWNQSYCHMPRRYRLWVR